MRLALCAVLALTATAAKAEHLLIDHRLYPELSAAMDNQRDNVYFVSSENPRYVLDRIKITGKSPTDYTEALEIRVTPRDKAIGDPLAWFAAYKAGEDKRCASEWTVLESDAQSITFTRAPGACRDLTGESRITRAVLGKHDVYLVAGLDRGAMSEAQRRQWLALLASAHIDG